MVQLLLLHETHFQLKSPEWGNNSNSFGHYCSDSCKGLESLFKYGCMALTRLSIHWATTIGGSTR